MANGKVWVSPDGRISKTILNNGKGGLKPTENCECIITISNTSYDVRKYNKSPVIIGDSFDCFERLLDIVLTMMNEDEKSRIIFKLKEGNVDFILELKTFTSNGFIFEWSARKKFELAIRHKEAGVDLYKKSHYVDASHRFSKAIKLLISIPMAVDEPPSEVDGLNICEVGSLQTNLCNNLASCYLKQHDYETVIELCRRVLKVDADNVKALYKMAISQYEVHAYDAALETLENVLKLDPDNKAAAEKMKDFVNKVNEANAKMNAMIKKMFV